MPDFVTDQTKSGGYLELIRVENVLGQLRKRGEAFRLSLKEAAQKFLPLQRDKRILLNSKRGQYIGLRSAGNATICFILETRLDKGDISWLFKKDPKLESSIKEIYLIVENYKSRNVTETSSARGAI